MSKRPTCVEKGIGVPFIHVSQNPKFANGRHMAHLARLARHPKTIGFEDIVQEALYVVEENTRYSSVPSTYPYVQKSLEGHPANIHPIPRVGDGHTYPKVSPKAKTELDARPYLTNVGAYWETMQSWAVVARLSTNSICAPVLKDCLSRFSTLVKDFDEL